MKRHLLPLTIAMCVTAIVHAPAVHTFFAQDDFTFLSRAAGLARPDHFFRPIPCWLVFKAEYFAFRLHPFPYHLVNLAVHALNVALLWSLTTRLGASPRSATAAGIVFGVSPATFTPLHWATGITELLGATFLLLATHCAMARGSQRMLWLSAFLAFLAMLSKETAIAWGGAYVLLRTRITGGRLTFSQLAPAIVATVCFVGFLMLGESSHPLGGSNAYALSASPGFLLCNLTTYVRWAVDVTLAIPDVVAVADPTAWRIAVPVLLATIALLWNLRGAQERVAAWFGLGWWWVFLFPVLPLAHHTYAYYLYIPSIGGALFVAFVGGALGARWPASVARGVAIGSVATYVLVQAHNFSTREGATWNALPVDRTIRDATLVQHCLAGLRQADLPPGSTIQFVNPVPGPGFDLMTGGPTRADIKGQRASYYPLEGALRGGEMLKLYFPGLSYGGFSSKVPTSSQTIDCFYFEQRGWLQYWGRGQDALMHQAELEAKLARGR